MVTGIKFSPDGKFLITVGGWMYFTWRLGGLLRSAMKERMLSFMLSPNATERANDAVVLPLPPPPPTNVPSSIPQSK